MGKLVYSAITSLDGFVADANDNFDWAEPDAEVHAFVNDIERPIGTYLYGRGLYDVLVAWETLPTADEPEYIQDFAAIWRAADKIVYSTTLKSAASEKTRIEREFDPATISEMKANADRDISVGGAQLAGAAITAGLVDELHQFVTPILVGGGRHWLPRDVRLPLELAEERRFASGVVYLHYRVGAPPVTPASD